VATHGENRGARSEKIEAIDCLLLAEAAGGAVGGEASPGAAARENRNADGYCEAPMNAASVGIAGIGGTSAYPPAEFAPRRLRKRRDDPLAYFDCCSWSFRAASA
jgi:hypothetical protein